jgi:hypothetical protein
MGLPINRNASAAPFDGFSTAFGLIPAFKIAPIVLTAKRRRLQPLVRRQPVYVLPTLSFSF